MDPISKSAWYTETNKQAVTKVVSLVKMAEKHLSVSCTCTWNWVLFQELLEKKCYGKCPKISYTKVWQNGICKQCRSRSDCCFRSSLIRVYNVCCSTKCIKKQLHKKKNLGTKSMEQSVWIFRTFILVFACFKKINTKCVNFRASHFTPNTNTFPTCLAHNEWQRKCS